MDNDGIFERIYGTVRRIPRGKAASYGCVAALSGNPRWSRVAGYAMRACSDGSVPCHRVVFKDGSLSHTFGAGGSLQQRALLESEGVAFLPDGRVDMELCGWSGEGGE